MTLGMRNMWSVQGPASSLNCPAILVLEFWSMDNESPIAFPWGGRPSASSLRFSFRCMGFSLWWLLWWQRRGPGMLRLQ